MSLVDRILGRAPSAPRIAAAASAPPEGPPVGTRSTPGAGRWYASTALSRDEAVDATPQSVHRIFEEAATGRTTRLIDLYKHTRGKDSRLDTACATRVHAISGRPWVVKPPPGYEDDARAAEVAANVTSILNETQGLSTLFGHLGHATLEHLAVLQHRWSRDARGWWVTRPEWVHPNRFGWRLPDVVPTWSQTEVGTDEAGKPVAGRALSEWPDRFVIFSPVAGRSDYPWMRGALRSRVAISVVKRLGFRWWLKMIERWGQPQVYAERSDTGTTGDTSESDEVIAALRAISSDWRATVPAGYSFKSIPVSVQADLHRQFLEYVDRGDDIAILGQNLTTEIKGGGSYAAAMAHQNVRLDILAGDLAELSEAVTDQWIEPLVRFNWPGAPVPYLDFVIGWKSEITVQEYQAGLYTADEVRGSKGHEPEPGGTGKRRFAGVAPTTKTITAKPSGQPDAELVEVDVEEAPTTPEGEDVAKEAASNAATVSDLAFNGAQVQALQGMIAGVATELAPRAVELALTTAFPAVDDATAAEMVRSQADFVATKKPEEQRSALQAATAPEGEAP